MAFTPVNDGDLAIAPQVQQILDALAGVAGAGQAIQLTSLESASDHALAIKNIGTGGLALHVYSSAGADLFDVRDAYTDVDNGTLRVSHSTNRVGINNTSPAVALDVTGSASISGTLTIGSMALTDPLTMTQAAAPAAPSAGLTKLYATTLGGAGLMPASATAPRFLADSKSLGTFNILDYGALPGSGNATATTTAIEAAYTALVAAGGGTITVPAGEYYHTNLSFTDATAFAIRGAGPYVSSLCSTTTTGDAIAINGPSLFAISDLGLRPNGNRDAGTYLLEVTNCLNVWVDRMFAGNRSGGLFKFDSCNSVLMSAVKGLSSDGTTGDTCLRLISSSGSFTDLNLQTGAGGVNRAPTVWVSGTVTSARWANNVFGGIGYRASYAISGIASDAAKFTVTTSANHDFVVGDIVAIRGTSGTGSSTYNDAWRVATVPTAATFTVTTTANPGTPTVTSATAESIASGFLAENSDGPLNENMVANTLVSNQSAAVYGTVGFHFDGKRGTYSLQGWELTGNWYDAGRTGLLISGKDTGSTTCTAYGFTVNGGKFAQITRPIHLDKCAGVTISGVHAGNTGATASANDGIATNAALYIYNGGTAPYTQGISVSNSHLGWPRDMATMAASTPMTYGVLLDGGSMMNLLFEGNQIVGSTSAFGIVNSALSNGLVWKAEGNICGSGTLPIAVNTVLPTIASATSIAATVGYDAFIVSGTTNIATITNGWLGRRITLLFSGALSLVTGGNLAIGANRTILAGDSVDLVFDGASWFVR